MDVAGRRPAGGAPRDLLRAGRLRGEGGHGEPLRGSAERRADAAPRKRCPYRMAMLAV